MSVFNPELRENRESKWEANRFSPDLQKKLLKALDDGKDRFPDIVQCPNQSCGNPLKIEMQVDAVHVYCTNCGWESVVRRAPISSSRKDRKYSIVPYQPSWATDFETIKEQIASVFGDLAVEIMHVGSTAILGMSGKSTIDVLVIVSVISEVDDLNGTMSELGYAALGEYVAPNGRLFAKEVNNERLVNVHCFEKDHPHAQEMIVMRDFLQSHPDEAKAYADLKIRLYEQYPDDYQAYRHVKDPYLAEMKVRAMEWGRTHR